MAKKTTPKAKAETRVRFVNYTREGSEAPRVMPRSTDSTPYVYHGWDNLYPEEVRTLVDNCGPLERCVTMLAEFIAGNGIRFYDKEGNEIEAAQAKFQEWMSDSTEEQFLAQTAYDVAHGLGLTWVVRRAFGGAIARIDHRDRFGFRAGKTDGGAIPAMYWSSDWKEATMNSADEAVRPVPIPLFDFTGKRKDAESVIFRKQYRPREPVYGRIFWLGCKRAAEVWIKVDNYNRTQIDTGFSPAVILGTRFDGTDAERDMHDERVEESLTGSMGRALMHFSMGVDEGEPFVQVLQRGNHAGELDQMRSGSADVIYDTFGIPSLLLRDREAGLTSQKDAILMRLQQLQRTLVSTMQKLITAPLTQLMNMEGVPVWEAKITPLDVFDVVQSEAVIMASTTVDEAREQRGEEAMDDKEAGKKLLIDAKTPAPAPVMPGASPKVGPDGKPIKPEDKTAPIPEP